MTTLFKQPPSSICILRLSAIGDVCHALAAVQALQRHWPNTQVTWIIGKIEYQLLKDSPGIEFIVYDKHSGYAGMKALWQQLQGRRFDALVHMQLALRASLLTAGIRAKYKIGFNFKRAKELQWLFTNRKIQDTESAHVLDSFFSFIEYLGVPRSQPQWQLAISADDKALVQQWLQNKPTIAICPAASKDERNWLPERYAAIADYLAAKGYQVVLCGSPAEREIQLAASISAKMHTQALNLVGKTSLKQLAAVLGACKLVIAPDSGPAHIATTQYTPVLGLYAHSNPKRTGPYNNVNDVVSVYEQAVEQQQGKPADTLPWSTRAKGEHLMANISLEQVQEKIDYLLAKS